MAGISSQDDPDLANLQSSFDEQQAKISALREIIRQTEAVNDMKHANAQEKVKNIAQRLTHFKTKVTTSRLNRASSIGSSSQSLATIDQGVALKESSVDVRPDPRSPAFPRGRSESSGMEKCSLLRQQIEQNRLKMAERESREREIEEKVIEIKHKLEATQQSLERSGELDRFSTTYLAEIVSSVGEGVGGAREGRDATYSLSDSLRRSYSHSFLDPGPAHETISTPIKPVPDSEEQFNEELTKYENNVRHAQVKRKNDEMLEQRITTLEDDLHEKERIIDEQLRSLSLLVNSLLEEDNKSDLELVKELHNLQIKLLHQSYSISNEEAILRLLDSYGYDPLEKAAERKKKQLQAVPTPLTRLNQPETSDDAKVQLYDAMEKIGTLEQALASQDIEMERMNQHITDLRQSLEEKTIELNVMAANVSVLQEKLKTSGPKPLFPRSADEELESETTKLKQQLDDSNKNMIKCKLKIKQLQKQVDTFKKTSNVHEEIAKLSEENTVLAQRLAELNDRDTDDIRFDATDPKPVGPELQKHIEMLELTCQNQATAMQLLEEQKNDLSDDLNRTRHELQSLTDHVTVTEGDGDNGRIASQMLSIELEEKLEKCLADKSELTKVLHSWEAEKSELQQTLKRYAEENAELMGKIDKLSLEKVSSAESIEILENLTLHEKQEMENSEKRTKTDDGATAVDDSDEIVQNVLGGKEDINESLLKLMEESKELMDKVELFTDERREVLEKLDAISIENQAYVSELDKLKEANEQLRSYSVELASAKSDLEDKLRTINEEKESIRQELDTVKVRRVEGDESSVTLSPPAQMTVTASDETFDNHIYQQTLLAVETDITNYNKNKDKQKKMQLAKKLTVSGKALVTMSRQLMDEYDRCKDDRAARAFGKDSAISTLETKLAETVKCLESKASHLALLQEEIALLKHELEVAYEKSSDDEPELLKVELNSKNDEIMLLKKDIDALVDAKSSELLQIQHRLLEAQQENHQLKTYTAELQYQVESVSKQQAKETETLNHQIDRLQLELRNAVSNVPESATEDLEGELQHKQETIDTLNGQIIDLYRTLEEHQSQVDECRVQKEQIEQKNEELLEKLKKFAANLKKKNVQCTKLEKDIEVLKEANRKLNEQLEHLAAESTPADAVSELSQEKEQLTQKMYHLNNELHRLLEQKYHMESESASIREELQKVNEQHTMVQAELMSKTDALQSLEVELQACKDEMQTLHAELTSKNGKIDKCKAIIKEKIKETQRLQERERRAAYLEDELRMTQSKLEDFHNQTLLLGRLKSEKEELNVTVRAEHEQRKALEEQLANVQQQLAVTQERDSTLNEQLRGAERWMQQYSERWRKRYEQTAPLNVEEPIETPQDVFSWLTLLVETDRGITEMLTRQMETISALEASLKTTENRESNEVSHLQGLLQSAIHERDSYIDGFATKDEEIKQLNCELTSKTADLQKAFAENTLMQSQQTELTAALGEIERLKEHLDRSQQTEQAELRNVVETANRERLAIEQRLHEASQNNAELLEEVAKLRDNIQSLELELAAERSNITRLAESTFNRLEEITQLRESLSEAEERYSKQCDRYKDYETIQVQLVEEKQQKEQLNHALKQREQEIQTLRQECDELREHHDDAGKLQSIEMDGLKQRLHDMEQMRAGWETSLAQFRAENVEQTDEIAKLRDTIASLERQTQEDKMNISILTSLNDALNEDLDMLQQQTGVAEQRYQSLMDEMNQTKSALEVGEAQQCHLQQQIDDAIERYRALQVEYEQKKLALESAETDVLQESNRREELSSALQTKEKECEQLQQKCAELREECDQLQRTVDETKASAVRQEQSEAEPKPDQDLGMWDDADAGWGTVDTARLEALVREKDELIQQLGAEKDLMQQEITDLKVKSGKLLRKVKECRVKLDAQQTDPAGGRAGSSESQDALEAKVRALEEERTELLREKEANVLKLDMLESACEKLTEVKEYQDKQIEMLRDSVATTNASSEMEELREKVQQLTATLQTRQSEIAHLNARLEQLTGEVECMDELRAQLTEVQSQNVQLQSTGSVQASVPAFHDQAHSMELQLAALEHNNRLLDQEKAEMSRELEVLNQQILQDLQFEDRLNKALLELDAKGVEIQMLRSTLDQLQQGETVGTVSATSEPSHDATPDPLTSLQDRIQELERERTELCQKLSAVGESNSAESGSVARVDDATVREVLERQEVEIVTLKEQLALRSAEYARLAARVDPTKLFASGLSGSEPVPKPEQQQQSTGDRVPQAELELALYMIYQRDMRCDELELELRNLLQERDTLQLRLSNALRMHEEFKIRLQSGAIPVEQEYGTSGECSIDASPDRSLSGVPLDERPVSSLSGPQDLTSKLSELQSISYSKEKRWQEEREERNRQLTLIQRDLANMPVEAAAKIAGTDMTADAEATTQQSASTVLLNWILGKK